MTEKRTTYHHGDLRAALIRAADEIVSENGIENFSLRAAAKRAGVSPAAPAHHFGNTGGLLTEVALQGFERVDDYLEGVGHSGDATRDLRDLALAFVRFAVDHPGHFRLMFRNDLIYRDHPLYPQVSGSSAMRFVDAVAAYQGKPALSLDHFEDVADLFGALATIHGLAHLVLAEKGTSLFGHANARVFVESELPRVLERIYPDRKME